MFLITGAYAIRDKLPIVNVKTDRYLTVVLPIETILVGLVAMTFSFVMIVNMFYLWLIDDVGFFDVYDLLLTIVIHVLLMLVGALLCYKEIKLYINNQQLTRAYKNTPFLLSNKCLFRLGVVLILIGVWQGFF